MFTWDWVCKHTVFFTLSTGRQAAQEDRQHRKTGSTGRQAAGSTRALCTICSHGAQLHHQSFVHNLFTVACSAQPQGVLSPVG